MAVPQPQPSEPFHDAVLWRWWCWLKADILEGVRAGEAGDVIPAEEVWKRLGLNDGRPERVRILTAYLALLEFTGPALLDLASLRSYVATDSGSEFRAQAFIERIKSRCDTLITFPLMGVYAPNFSLISARSPSAPSLCFTVTSETATSYVIERVVDGRRDLERSLPKTFEQFLPGQWKRRFTRHRKRYERYSETPNIYNIG